VDVKKELNYKIKQNKMEETKITLDSSMAGTNEVKKDALYLVDFSKIGKVEDLVLIFAALGLSFRGDHPFIDQIKEFLNLENPIYPQQGQPTQMDIKLPKLKPIK
jgi:hypothetical protein